MIAGTDLASHYSLKVMCGVWPNARSLMVWMNTSHHPVFTDKSQLRVEPLYLDKAEAAAFLSVSVSTFEKLLREDATFPRPRALSPNRNGYLVTELRVWGQARPIADRLPPANTSRTISGLHKATSPTAPSVRSVW